MSAAKRFYVLLSRCFQVVGFFFHARDFFLRILLPLQLQRYGDRSLSLLNVNSQETLTVTVGELRRLRDGIDLDEVQRVQAGLKSSLIMQQESTSSRAMALASDWYYLGRVRPVEEVQAAVDAFGLDEPWKQRADRQPVDVARMDAGQ